MTTPKPFNIMSKPIGPRCNIDCSYCYYLEKEEQFPDEKKFRMSDEVLDRYVRELIDASARAGMPETTFAWQGGEPTMLGVGFFEKAVALQKQYAPEGMKIVNAFQTNGILLNADWGRFLSENGFLVGISIDGPKQVHDRYRLDRAGRPTFDNVMRGLEVLQTHGVEHNALTVVHRANSGKGKEIYRFLKGLGIEFMQFIPIVERSALGHLGKAPQIDMDPELAVTSWSASPKAYGKFLCEIFDIWFKKDIGTVFVQHFDSMLGKWLGSPGGLCIFAETCGDGLALEHNGNLYACDHFVYPEYLLGNIMDGPMGDMLWSEKQAKFGTDKRDTLTKQCQSCEFRFACNGGCPKHRFARSHSGEDGHNYFCEAYTMFFRHAGDRLSKMARDIRLGGRR